MDALKYFQEKARMTKVDSTGHCRIDCEDCGLSQYNNEYNLTCVRLERLYPKEAIAIVQKWSEEHPVKTLLQDLLEHYPNCKLGLKGIPAFCPSLLGYSIEQCGEINCIECWGQPMEEKP